MFLECDFPKTIDDEFILDLVIEELHFEENIVLQMKIFCKRMSILRYPYGVVC